MNPELAGGAILDLGPYPALWAMLLIHRHPQNTDLDPKVVSSYQRIYERTGVDALSHWVVRWDGFADAFLTADMTIQSSRESCVIAHCEGADLVIECGSRTCRNLLNADPPFKPSRFHIVPHAPLEADGAVVLPGQSRVPMIETRSTHDCPIALGGGWHYQADEVARCIRERRLESHRMPLRESLTVQRWFDTVAARSGA